MMDSKIANEIFRYDAESGKLFWRIKPCDKVVLGAEVKTKHSAGYLTVCYKSKIYGVYRIIWLMTYGRFLNGHIDHQPQNNRLVNLRDVSTSSNQRNQSISSRNTSGFRCEFS